MTPIAQLITYQHQRKHALPKHHPKLLVITCMDGRVNFYFPPGFAYVLRTPGARIDHSDFAISVLIALKNIRHIALIGHTDCAMVELGSKCEQYVDGMKAELGWKKKKSEHFFHQQSRHYAIPELHAYLKKQAEHLRKLFQGITITPLIFHLEDQTIHRV